MIPSAKNAEFWQLGSSTGLANLCETRLNTPVSRRTGSSFEPDRLDYEPPDFLLLLLLLLAFCIVPWGIWSLLARIIHERPRVPIFGTQVMVAPVARGGRGLEVI